MATIASLDVLIGADVSGLQRALKSATKDLERTGERMRTIGANMTAAFTLPLVGIGVAATKAAVDFESSFAGIRKTMSLTEAEFQKLAAANRQLAQDIPVAVDELNRIGELAGQLGIRGVDNVLKFERTIAQLTVTTDLAADEAALAFAQIANVLQLPQDQVDRLGAAVVGLGNNFATVESAIVEFTSRIAGAGQLAGLSAGSVAGIATAFSSLGVNAEAGGTAVQKVLLAMQQAVVQGGDQLEAFAATAGTSAGEFAEAFSTDAGQAFVQFVEGLGSQGDQAIATLEQLGLTDQRLTRAFLAAAGAGDLLSRAVAQGNEEFEANTALTEEAAKRFQTAGSQFQIFQNRLRDVAITLGDALVPALLSMLEAAEPLFGIVRGIAEAFAGLDPRLQTAILALGALAAAAGPLLIVLGTIATTLPAIGAAFSVLLGPIGLVAAAVTALVVVWVQFGDDIKRIVAETFTAVKTWLVDRFTAIVDSVREKVGAIGDFFGDLFDRVVGGSFVPDLIDGIASEFARLDEVMVQPALDATRKVTDAFAGIQAPDIGTVSSVNIGASRPSSVAIDSAAADAAEQIGDSISSKVGGIIEAGLSGPVAQLAQSVATFGPLGLLVPIITEALEVLEPVLLALLEPLTILGRLVGAILVPVLTALEGPLRLFARIITFVVQGLGFFIEVLARAVNAIIPFGSPLDFLVDFGQNMQDEAVLARQALSNAGSGATEFADAAKDAADAAKGAADSFKAASIVLGTGERTRTGLGRLRQRAELFDLTPQEQFVALQQFLEDLLPGGGVFGLDQARFGDNLEPAINALIRIQETDTTHIGGIPIESILDVVSAMEQLGDESTEVAEQIGDAADELARRRRRQRSLLSARFELLDIPIEGQIAQIQSALSELLPPDLANQLRTDFGGFATTLLSAARTAIEQGEDQIFGVDIDFLVGLTRDLESLQDQAGETADEINNVTSELLNAPAGFKVALARFNATRAGFTNAPIQASSDSEAAAKLLAQVFGGPPIRIPQPPVVSPGGGGPRFTGHVPQPQFRGTDPRVPTTDIPIEIREGDTHIHTVNIDAGDKSPEQLWRELQPVIKRDGKRGGAGALDVRKT